MKKPQFVKEFLNSLRPHQKNNKPNTWEWVRAQRELLSTDTKNYPYRESVEDMWEHMEHWYRISDGSSLIERDDDQKYGENPVQALLSLDEIGFYPPPETLTAIADSFRLYLATDGGMTLEECFFGPVKKGVGNYSARKKQEENYVGFNFFCRWESINVLKPPSLETMAEKYIDQNFSLIDIEDFGGKKMEGVENDVDVESFLRGYRRWKTKINEQTTDN